MHTTAYLTGKCFFDIYVTDTTKVLEVGSQNVNGSLRDHAINKSNYLGIDFCPGKGVDLVLEDPYKYPFQDETFDVVVTSSCLEHSEFFWITYLECLRVLKPPGILYCNAPANRMPYHRHPVDCWRFMPDSSKALEAWAQYNNIPAKVLETFTVEPIPSERSKCFDWCAIFIKDQQYMSQYSKRMVDYLNLSSINIFKFQTPEDNNWSYILNHKKAE